MRFPDLSRFPYFAYDTETTGLKWEKGDYVFGFSISTPDGKDYYYDIREEPEAWEWWGDNIRYYRGIVVCHNASFDYHFTRRSSVNIPLHLLDDTGIRACLLWEHFMSYDLDNLGRRCINARKVDIVPELQKLFGGRSTKNVQMRNIPDAPSSLVGVYAKQDTRVTLDLWEWQQDQIAQEEGMQADDGRWLIPPLNQIVEFERSLMPEVIANEAKGVRVDTIAAEKACVSLTKQIAPIQKELDDLHGSAVDVNSHPQMQKVFAPKLEQSGTWAVNGVPVPTTDSGNASLNADALLGLEEAGDPRAILVLQVRKLLKLRDTFLNGHVLESEANGRVHPRVHQTKGEDGGTGTGRFSYSDPALQQIPSRDKEVSSFIRPVFLPDEGHSWVDADMSSFEVRVFAHLVNNPRIVAEYRDNPFLDLHQYVAELTSLPRNKPPEGGPNAKQLNLSMIFNSGNGSIAQQMGLPWKWESFLPKGKQDVPENWITYRKPGPEAKSAINRYHGRMPGVREFADGAKDRAIDRGYVFTKMGRRLRFPRGFKAYKASGLIIQATAADWNKQNWLLTSQALDGEGRMLLNTHDSYSLSLPIGQEEKLVRRVKNAIESEPRSRVPLILEVNHPGRTWWDSYSSDIWIK